MLTEISPFLVTGDPTQHLTEQKVAKLEFTWVDGVDEVPKDWVSSIMRLRPEDRLGCRADGGVDYEALRQHPFLQQGLHANASSTLEGNPKVPRRKYDLSKEVKIPEVESPVTGEIYRKWAPFLIPGESIVMEGVLKQAKIFFRTIQHRWLLTEMHSSNTGSRILARLIYIDEAKMVYRGDVPWSGDIRVEMDDAHKFKVVTPRSTFALEDPEGRAGEWVKAITRLVELTPKPKERPPTENPNNSCSMFRCF